jgi:hypothetical protein
MTAETRASDARMRRRIRAAFARQRAGAHEIEAPVGLRVVPPADPER